MCASAPLARSYAGRVFVNTMPRYEVLSEGSMAVLEEGWRSIVRDIGIEFQWEPALELFRAAGQTVEGELVKLDPDFVLEQVAKAPSEFGITARNPARSRRFGGDNMIFCSVQSAPFVSEGDRRGDGTFDDYRRLVRLTHTIDELDTAGYPICEAGDLPIDSRHLQMLLTLYTDSDKPLGTAQFNPVGCGDSIAMAEIAFGREALEREPHMFGIANANSPLRFDERMIGSLMLLAAAGQIVVVTPFILMGAMGPVSIPAALSQQIAEQLAGICLAQLVRPGAPVVMGSFISHTDMQSGSPGFGGPEAAIGLLASGQIARRFGLPWRAGGGALTSSQSVDAQAAFEGLNTMLPAFLAGANLLLHTCGWLESGLVASLREVRARHRDRAHPAARVQPARVHARAARARRLRRGRPRRALLRHDAHARELPQLLLPPAAVLDRELRALGLARRQGRRPSAPATAWPSSRRATSRPRRSTTTCAARLEEYVARRQKELGD